MEAFFLPMSRHTNGTLTRKSNALHDRKKGLAA
jgi:hypothetical protein